MKKTKQIQPQISVALIDDRGIYMGVQMIDAASKTDAHIEVPADCDLAKDKYRWDTLRQTFVADVGLTIAQRKQIKRGR